MPVLNLTTSWTQVLDGQQDNETFVEVTEGVVYLLTEGSSSPVVDATAFNAVGFRYRVAANATATMKAICGTVKSEGGDSLRNLGGVPYSANMGVTPKTISTTRLPLMSIRAGATFNAVPNLGLLLPKSFSLSIDNPVRVDLILNGTLTGASFVAVDTLSGAEADTTATAVTGGQVVYSEYISTNKNTASAGQGILGREVLWNRLSSLPGTLTIAAVRTSATDADCLASMSWEEVR